MNQNQLPIGKIIINAEPGGVITHTPVNAVHESLIHSNHVRSITVRLADERNRLLDLNGLHFQIGISFKFVSLHKQDPEPGRPSLVAPPPPQPEEQPPLKSQRANPRQKKAKRRQLLRKGKAKVRVAQQRLSEQQREATKNIETPVTHHLKL